MGSDKGEGGWAVGKRGRAGATDGTAGKDRKGKYWSGGAEGEILESSQTSH